MAKWMPAAGKARLYKSFMDLKQGDMTIAEYERRFDELSKFGPGLIETPLLKNEKFIAGPDQSSMTCLLLMCMVPLRAD